MTRVGGSDGGPVGQGGPGTSGDDRLQSGQHPYARSDARTATFDGKQRPGGKVTTLAEATDRAAAFQKSVAAAELKAKGEPATTASGEPRVDTIAAAFAWRGGEPGAAAAQPAAASPAAATPSTAPAVAALVERIEQAVKAELFAGAGRPAAIHLDLGDLIAGLKSLAIVITDGALEVTLVRGEGQASEEMVRAAQELADRLQHRFGKRIVRVLDAADDAAGASADEPGTLQAISRILGNSATRS